MMSDLNISYEIIWVIAARGNFDLKCYLNWQITITLKLQKQWSKLVLTYLLAVGETFIYSRDFSSFLGSGTFWRVLLGEAERLQEQRIAIQ